SLADHLGTADLLRCRAERSSARSPVAELLVVLCGQRVPEEAAAELHRLARRAASDAVVVTVGGGADALHALTLGPGDRRASSRVLASVVAPQLIDPDEMQAVDSLLEGASDRRSVARTSAPYDSLSVRLPALPVPTGPELADEEPVQQVLGVKARRDHPDPDPDPDPDVESDPDLGVDVDDEVPEIEVCVLGPVEVRGAARAFTRAWALELVVYLAMHPNGASNEVWATALWPDRVMAPSSLHSTASVARRALGRSRTGEDHLPRSHGRLRLASTVGTDWDRFVSRCEESTPASWRTALELVRGQPFTGLRASDWPVLEGIAPAIEATVVDVSGRLSGACLRAGDPQGAEWAARKGLLVSPYDERLYRMLMRAADAAGNPAGVETAMSELVRLVGEDVEPLDSVHPSTLELYRSLSRRHTAGHPARRTKDRSLSGATATPRQAPAPPAAVLRGRARPSSPRS
ncbi:MAG TPA: bacterial transcriptional activator domain-containing protein, partial [Acidimicrobiales bacterium]|nr:bacterial transcriptional activator domain-containing protein [Acidimicrobiales bacterium]